MNLKINLLPEEKKGKPDLNNLEFGKKFTDHMFTMKYSPDKCWHSASIEPYKEYNCSPATMTFHYAQSGFEGMKAYKYKNSAMALFRPFENFKRLNRTSKRLVMPEFDEDFVYAALVELLRIEKKWMPSQRGTALYIRPFMMGIDPIIRLRSSDEFAFYIIMSPVGAYYKNGFSPAKILVETEFVRACEGGTGNVKASANYGMSLVAGKKASSLGYDQALWLDAKERRFVEEVGSMNIFFVINSKIFTPPLDRGTVLPGITRDSVIKLAAYMGYDVQECELDIHDIVKGIEAGEVTECFGTGTAAVISPVGILGYMGRDYKIGNGEVGEVSQKIFDHYTGIQYGEKEDIFNWVRVIE